jgi:hypothetical protein
MEKGRHWKTLGSNIPITDSKRFSFVGNVTDETLNALAGKFPAEHYELVSESGARCTRHRVLFTPVDGSPPFEISYRPAHGIDLYPEKELDFTPIQERIGKEDNPTGLSWTKVPPVSLPPGSGPVPWTVVKGHVQLIGPSFLAGCPACEHIARCP